MNKKQLASKIWESANRMRSKIEANEYKDYILGFIFYKFLSEQEEKYLLKNDFTPEDIKAISEDTPDIVEYLQKNIGYFISYENLFSTWLKMGGDFSAGNVTDAVNAFDRLISPTYKKLFSRIFNTLETGLSKLGESSGARTKAISGLIELINQIPMDGKQDYDVLGFIYEYLISNFAANAGKKAGEFYTPHEVSLLMSEIIADFLKDRKEIQIYDPTSGSGSLLINIGRAVAKHIDDANNIKYYAQELKENTYNLTRMNLVMRGIKPSNIVTRNADTLDADWPYFDETDPDHTYSPLFVDAVVSNPPYSQHWNPANKENNPRFADYGLAPKTKADYAFLLHDLYHLKSNGVMTIVLPHGVLFRGGEEKTIRENLIENNNIDVIIGLPANIFFGTGIPTIIMVLKKKRVNDDVLIIDASKGFEKVGKNNKLRACDIKKVADVVSARAAVDKFSRAVSRDEIRANEYNLNIPRYVDSSEDAESWDIYASMFGGIPKSEADKLAAYWQTFPSLKSALFSDDGTPYLSLTVEDVKNALDENEDVKTFSARFSAAFGDFNAFLEKELIDNMTSVSIPKEENIINDNITVRLAAFPLVDKYGVYQTLDDEWLKTSGDLEIIQTEGFEAVRQVDPKMVVKKKNGEDVEVQDGWLGHVIPFDRVQTKFLKDESDAIQDKRDRIADMLSEYEEVIGELDEEQQEELLNEDENAFDLPKLTSKINEIYSELDTDEIKAVRGYIALCGEKAKKIEKERYVLEHKEVRWDNITTAALCSKSEATNYLLNLEQEYVFPEDSYEAKIVRTFKLIREEDRLNYEIKQDEAQLEQHTKETIENLSDEQAIELLKIKWVYTLADKIQKAPAAIIKELENRVLALAEKYAETFADVAAQIKDSEKELCAMIDELEGNEFDMKGLSEFKSLLQGK